MKVFYWSPFISEVATTFAVANSIKSIHKFSKNKKIDCKIIDVFNEWQPYHEILSENKIEIIKLKTFLDIKKLPTKGFLKSRFTYVLVLLFSIFELHKKIKKEEPDYFIIHLISYVPLILMSIFNYKTKFILRISGFPKMTYLRKLFWKLSNKNLHKIFCPTKNTKINLIKNNIFSEKKMHNVNDPVIDVKKIMKKKREKIGSEYNWLNNKRYVLSIGRLSNQKNFIFLIKNFKKILEKSPDINLVILGEGEDRDYLEQFIKDQNLDKSVFLLGYQENVYPFLNSCLFFVLTSNWEDPGFVILEAMFSRKIVLSSNCESGPTEIIKDGINGFLYKNNDENDFIEKFFTILELLKNQSKKQKIKTKSLLTCKKYSQFHHFNEISKYLV